MIARPICGLAKLTECDELLCRRRFHLKLKGAVYETYVGQAILYGSERKRD